MDYLVMRLYAPLSSWGAVAIGEERPTSDHPTRGAVLGLIGAALGVRRDDQKQLQALADSIGIASKIYSRGTILRDYHTIQTTAAVKGQRFHTRKQELQSAKLETILSSRDYREDGLWMVAIWLKPQSEQKNEQNARNHDYEFDLPALQQALERPKFTLYLGRKSCPLAMPLTPRIITATSIKQALDTSITRLLPIQEDASDQPVNHINRVNELLYQTVSDHWLPTEITIVTERRAGDEQTDNRKTDANVGAKTTRCRQVSYHWEGARDDLFGVSLSAKTTEHILTHRHWDDPIDRKQWQFTQRIGHEWSTFEPLTPFVDDAQPTDSTKPTDMTMDKTL